MYDISAEAPFGDELSRPRCRAPLAFPGSSRKDGDASGADEHIGIIQHLLPDADPSQLTQEHQYLQENGS